MEFKFSCPNCGQRIAATLDQVGARAACPSCSNTLNIPAVDTCGSQRKTPPPPPSSVAPAPPPIKKTKGNPAWACIVVVVLMILGFRGCFNESDAKRISKVLNRCAEISHRAAQFNHDPGRQANFIATEAQKIDVSNCPPDFRMAFQAHIFAWQQAAPSLANNNFGTHFLEGLVAGSTGDSGYIGGAGQEAAMATQQINDTYYRLTQIAARHGARIPTSVAGE